MHRSRPWLKRIADRDPNSVNGSDIIRGISRPSRSLRAVNPPSSRSLIAFWALVRPSPLEPEGATSNGVERPIAFSGVGRSTLFQKTSLSRVFNLVQQLNQAAHLLQQNACDTEAKPNADDE